ncbi:divergent polysaccharide deacetylase family protein [Natronincola ferrireducens]|uniref:Divergent polysaccharide deacetylase n=1 Tax=Natronincola ferrireducens TaxID=393762 RepID=A0A1G9I900_9FIRM|nr:divergent polysaccharide deacetylase family protein [Natronincola ferrireducens]SDL21525.1 hypothetical protein SAMN05660472_02828 [Natronincola ferrireducens]
MKNNFFVVTLRKKKIVYFMLALLALVILLLTAGELQNKRYDTLGNNYKKIAMVFIQRQPRVMKGQVAIIIDDFGNLGNGTKEMLAIDRPLTCAIIPFLPYTKEDAVLAHGNGHEIIIHIPMEPHVGNPKWLGEKGITTNLSTEQIKTIIREAVEEVPFAVGVNNHMGSKATEDSRVMAAIIQVVKENNMYIVDSKTSINSVVKKIAEEYNVPILERAVFLDNEKSVGAIKKQLKTLGELAIKDGSAIGIGHVGPEGGIITATAIKEMIPQLEKMGIEIVPVSHLTK